MEWIKVSDQMPPEDTDVLLCYKKGKSTWRGRTGVFITQGFLSYEPKRLSGGDKETEKFWTERGYGFVFYDYTERLIQNLQSKSANKVTHWAKLEVPEN